MKTVSNNIIIEAKHEERQDEHGYVSRQFLRRYVLPPSHDVNNITSSLSSDGVLTITAPKKVSNEKEKQRWPDESEDSSVAVDQPILSRLLLFFLLFCLFLFLDLFIFVFFGLRFFQFQSSGSAVVVVLEKMECRPFISIIIRVCSKLIHASRSTLLKRFEMRGNFKH